MASFKGPAPAGKEARKLVAAFRAVNQGADCVNGDISQRVKRVLPGSNALLSVVLAVALIGAAGAGGRAFAQSPNDAYQPQVQDSKFRTFITSFRADAVQAGIEPQTYANAMASIARNPRVEELNLEQPEFVKPIWEYLGSILTPARITMGQQLLRANAPTIDAIEKRFGVQREILVAIWGIESDYGRDKGSFNIFEALATLAYDGPRADFGRRELLDALRILQQERFRTADMTSSWAGAFGQTQFVPSSFLRYAVDGDGDGRRDLWNSAADALASAANLLAQSSWETMAPWGYQVVLPAGFRYRDADLDNLRPITDWRNLGVRAAAGWQLPVSDARSAIYLPAGASGPAFIVFDNFRTLLKYNNAASYALAVCLLADRLKGYAPLAAEWPRDTLPLMRSERLTLQADLARLGFDSGVPDGILGLQSRKALRAYQESRGLVADGYASQQLLARIEQELRGR